MRVIVKKDDNTEEEFVVGEEANVEAMLVSLAEGERDFIDQLPLDVTEFGRYNENIMSEEKYKEWARQVK